MSSLRLFGLIFAVLGALSVVAWLWRPASTPSGKSPLVWVSDNNPVRALQIAAFESAHPDLTVDLDYGNNSLEKIILQCSSGIGPDLFDYNSEQLETFKEAGVLYDVTDAAQTMGFSAQNDLWPAGVDTVVMDGRQYGYPCNLGTNILVYNKNVFDALGIPYPGGLMTWDEFVSLGKKINSAQRPGSPPIFAISGANWSLFFENLHGEFFTVDGRLNIAQSPELHRAFELHRQFLFTDRLMPTAVELKSLSGQGGWKAENLNYFAAGRFAMVVTGHWSLIAFGRVYQQQIADLHARGLREEDIPNPLDRPLRLGAVVVPKFADHAPSYRVQSRVAAINARSPRRAQALAFLQYLAGPAYSQLVNEGTDWLPGNPRYAALGLTVGPPALDRVGLQKATTDAMAYGYVQRRSPFLLTTDVLRVLNDQCSRMESEPALTTDALLQTAENELQTLLRRNLDRDPGMRKIYLERFGEAAYRALP